ncbi:MAG: OmpA family protein [Deltaproteobacteria bacterium]|nr:OmpA family protein [Deltaproteobacteria bacterium]
MRLALPTFGLSLALALHSVLLAPAAASAQDEFDDEFDEPAAQPAAPAAPAASDDEFDEFADEPATTNTDNSLQQDDLADAEADMGMGAMDDEAPPANDEAEPEDADARRGRLFRAQASLLGPVGGIHTVSAGSGATHSFRIGLTTDFFVSDGFIGPNDNASHVGGTLSLSWSVHDNVEIFASILSYANSNDLGDPSLLQVLGDTNLGVKAFTWITPVIAVGGDVNLSFLNSVGDIGLLFKGTSVAFRGNFTADLRGRANPFPFIFRFNAQYQFDNSNKLIRGVERRRYANLMDAAPDPANETRQLLTTVERFGLGINRVDMFNLAVGFEFPLRAMEDFYVSPMLEWTWGIPVNRQGYDCLVVPGSVGGDGCLDTGSAKAFPMDLTLGVRVLPPVRGLSILAAADIGLTGQNEFVRELAPNMPYDIMLGFAYAYDTEPRVSAEPEIREVVRRVEVPIPPPVQGRVHGVVVEQGANTPIAGATIAFSGRDLTSLLTSDDGTFTTYLLDPGEVRFEISHPDYNPGACVATIPSERPGAAPAAAATDSTATTPASEDDEFADDFGDEPAAATPEATATADAPTEFPDILVEVRCELTARPRVGSVDGRVVGDDGSGVIGATVQLMGPSTQNATTNSNGRFQASELPPGTYTARVEADGFLIKLQQFDVQPREVASPEITLVRRPRRPLVRVRRRSLSIRRQINFATNSAEILPSSDGLMSEIADVLIRNPQLQLLEIQGHTDNRGGRAHNMDLSQRRADAVRTWLSTHGVEASRLESRGYGPDNPLVPNITPANRARNRRVQFIIKQQGEAAE